MGGFNKFDIYDSFSENMQGKHLTGLWNCWSKSYMGVSYDLGSDSIYGAVSPVQNSRSGNQPIWQPSWGMFFFYY